MMEEPACLPVGTEVSAKYRGAFCEAKVKKIVKSVKCKVTLKESGLHIMVQDDDVKGNVKVGAIVEVKHPETGQGVLAVINKINDASMYTVVFDDGDENTLRRSQLCLKGEKHFVKSETLDDLPLTHPEHFGTPVMKGSKGLKRRRAASGMTLESESEEESSDESVAKQPTYRGRLQELIGRILCMELEDRKRKMWVPVLVTQPGADSLDLQTKDHLLVKSFKDSRFYTVTKKDTRDFTRDMAVKSDDKALKATYEKALLYHDTHELPQGWDKEELLGSDSEDDDDDVSSDDEPSEEKDHFVAQLYKFMDDRGTPINRGPQVSSRDLDLFKLFRLVQNLGGYNRVTNQMKWRIVYSKMNLPQSASGSNQIKAAYKKYLHAFEDFYRKLGNAMGTISRPRSRHSSGRSIISFRDREGTPKSPRPKKKEEDDDSCKEEDRDDKPKGSKAKADDKKAIKSESDSETESPRRQTRSRPIEEKKSAEVSRPVTREEMTKLREEKKAREEEAKRTSREKAESTRSGREKKAIKVEREELSSDEEKEDPKQLKRRTMRKSRGADEEEEDIKKKEDKVEKKTRKSVRDAEKEEPVAVSEDKEDSEDEGEDEESHSRAVLDYPIGSRVSIQYGRGRNAKMYEAKVMEVEDDAGSLHYLVHYAGWNNRYDEWVMGDRIIEVLEKGDSTKKAKTTKGHLNRAKPPLMKKKGRPPCPSPSAVRDAQRPSDKSGRSPGSTPPVSSSPKAHRPTRSTSVEGSLASGLPSSKPRPRKSPAHQTESDQQSRDSDSDNESDNDSYPPVKPQPPTKGLKDTTPSNMDKGGEPSHPDTSKKGGSKEERGKASKDLGSENLQLEEKEANNMLHEFNLISDDADLDDIDMNYVLEEDKKIETTVVEEEVQEPTTKVKEVKKEEEAMSPLDDSEKTQGEATGDGKKATVATEPPAEAPKESWQEKTNIKPKVKKKESAAKRKRGISTDGKAPESPSQNQVDVQKEEMPGEPKASQSPPRVTEEEKLPVEVKTEEVEEKKEEKKEEVPTVPTPKAEKGKRKTKAAKTEKDTPAEDKAVKAKPEKAEKGKGKRKLETETPAEQEKPTETTQDEADKKSKKKPKRKKVEDKPVEEGEGAKSGKVEKDPPKSLQEQSAAEQASFFHISEVTALAANILANISTSGDRGDVSKSGMLGKAGMEPGVHTSPAPRLEATPTMELKMAPEDMNATAPQLSPIACSSLRAGAPVVGAGTSQQHQQQQLDKSDAAIQGAMTLIAFENQGKMDIAHNSMYQNTPPETPEHTDQFSSAEGSPTREENGSTKSEHEANLEVASLMAAAAPPGGESPGACDASTISNGSGGSSGNAPGSESDVPCLGVKRKEETEEQSSSKRRKRGHHKRNGSEKGKHRHGAKQTMSDSDDGAESSHQVVKSETTTATITVTKSTASDSSGSNPSQSSQPRQPRPSKYKFVESLEEGKYLEGEKRIDFLMSKMHEIRRIYMELKAEVACIDRRRKRHRRKEREAAAAAAALAAQHNKTAAAETECS